MIDPDDPPRVWTVDEANGAIGRVGEAIERVRAAADSFGDRLTTSKQASEGRGNGHAAGGGERAVLHEAIESLEAEGIVVRDPERGLVDFAAKAPSGRGYWLCWLVGEPEVAWWHWPDAGFAGRTPLSDPPA